MGELGSMCSGNSTVFFFLLQVFRWHFDRCSFLLDELALDAHVLEKKKHNFFLDARKLQVYPVVRFFTTSSNRLLIYPVRTIHLRLKLMPHPMSLNCKAGRATAAVQV